MSERAQDINETEELNSDAEADTDAVFEEYDAINTEPLVAESVTAAVKRPLVATSLKFLLVGLLIFSVIVFIAGFIRYSELQNDKRALQEQIAEKQESIEESEYLLDVPITDRDYIIRIAKEKLGLFLPDEIVYYSDLND